MRTQSPNRVHRDQLINISLRRLTGAPKPAAVTDIRDDGYLYSGSSRLDDRGRPHVDSLVAALPRSRVS